ncbi:MAG: aromatic-ring-hydroxylating dioxygenase subunit beta [Proteobacteria bacterium]|nr:aromatic-ring-hydroxylating dioxygenase subunit beta [Burkholderiales bacterium]
MDAPASNVAAPRHVTGAQTAAPLISDAQRAAIDRMMVEYVHAIDEGEYERWPTFFTEDAVYQVTGRDNHARGWVAGMMLCDNRDMMLDRIYTLRQVNLWEPHTYRHVIGPTQILALDATGVVTAQTNYLCVRTMHDGEQKLFSTGRYLDRIVFEADVPRFRERLVISDSNRIDTLLVIPI